MDLQRQPDGRRHISLGPVEWAIVGGAASVLLVLVGIVYTGITSKIEDQARSQKELAASMALVSQQVAVTNGQIQTLTAQLADVPRLTRDMAEVKVRVEQHDLDIRELKQLRRVQ